MRHEYRCPKTLDGQEHYRCTCGYDEGPEVIGDCSWCSQPVFEDDDYECGNGGNGVMHLECEMDAECADRIARYEDR